MLFWHPRFSNWKSWHCYQNLFRDDDIYRQIRSEADHLTDTLVAGDKSAALGSHIERLLVSTVPEDLDGLWLDVINSLMEEVNWLEVAQEFIRLCEVPTTKSYPLDHASPVDTESVIAAIRSLVAEKQATPRLTDQSGTGINPHQASPDERSSAAARASSTDTLSQEM